MKTIKFIQNNGDNIFKLKEAFGITVKEYPEEGLYVLNYSQIDSPKTDPIVMECRGLILDDEFNVVSRSFSRFFNLGEAPETQKGLDWNKASIFSKVDGSLIKLYNWKNKWYFSTRGTAFAESDCMGFGVTFKDLCLKATEVDTDEEFQSLCNEVDLDPSITYLLELTSRENRVVTQYEGTSLHFLSARNNITGKYVSIPSKIKEGMNWKTVKSFSFSSSEEAVKAAEELPNLQEGYVVYQDGKPICKVKSPAYVAVHHLRGNGTPNVNRVMELVCIGEQEEYLTYFPEDRKYFTPYINTNSKLLTDMDEFFEGIKDIPAQKDFALAIKHLSYSWVLFMARKENSLPSEVFIKSSLSKRVNTLSKYLEMQ